MDRGLTWKRIGPDPSAKVAIIGGVLLAGTLAGSGFGRVYRSTNFGLKWDSVLGGGWDITAFARSGSNMFVSTGGFDGGNGVYLSTDSGATWTPVGPSGMTLNCIAVQDTMLWAGSPSELYYRPIAQMIGKSSVRELPPAETELTIYPNPAANSTTITYALSKPGMVNIAIVDALGRTAAVPIANASRGAGTYSIGFDSSRLPDGVYWCRLSTSSDAKIGKFVIGR
ncbi:MAG TPA: T9SS type A sorting domain-containing protein [Candidatus Kapabacteria bacterium]|nr:T9SS type A sorting domain-containing protein [Candidatus Kapabacteria bacterium]